MLFLCAFNCLTVTGVVSSHQNVSSMYIHHVTSAFVSHIIMKMRRLSFGFDYSKLRIGSLWNCWQVLRVELSLVFCWLYHSCHHISLVTFRQSFYDMLPLKGLVIYSSGSIGWTLVTYLLQLLTSAFVTVCKLHVLFFEIWRYVNILLN